VSSFGTSGVLLNPLTLIAIRKAYNFGLKTCIVDGEDLMKTRQERRMPSRFWWWPFSFGPSHVPGISAPTLKEALQKNAKPIFLVDVRNPSEFASGHIEGAFNVPIGQMKAQEVADKIKSFALERGCDTRDVEVVCICLSAHRSPPAVRLIQDVDPNLNVKQLDYGMAYWWLKKYESVKSQ
jgi:rhodanese-related sulfurtransferase